jgi:hypothetical protein
MNQLIADLVLALPAPLRDAGAMSVILLALCWLSYLFFIRTPLTRRIRERCSAQYLNVHMPHRYQYPFCRAVYKKAQLYACGWYTVNIVMFWSLCALTPLHIALLFLTRTGALPLLWQADLCLLSVLFSAVCLLSLMTQPQATLERRQRWGFRPVGNVVHAVLWEMLFVVLLFYWLYIAWFVGVL